MKLYCVCPVPQIISGIHPVIKHLFITSGFHCLSMRVFLRLRLRPLLRRPRVRLRLYRRRRPLLTYRRLLRPRKVLLNLLLGRPQRLLLQRLHGLLLVLHQAVAAGQVMGAPGVPVPRWEYEGDSVRRSAGEYKRDEDAQQGQDSRRK